MELHYLGREGRFKYKTNLNYFSFTKLSIQSDFTFNQKNEEFVIQVVEAVGVVGMAVLK